MALHLLGGRIQLLAAHVGGAVDHLALQVGEIHHVEIHQADAADAGGCQIQPQRRAQPARAHQQHFGGLQLLLALDADLRHDQVAAVAQDLVFDRAHFRRRGHPRSAGDGGHQRHRVAILHRRGVLAQIADVFVVQVDVDEAAQLAFVGENLFAQVAGIAR